MKKQAITIFKCASNRPQRKCSQRRARNSLRLQRKWFVYPLASSILTQLKEKKKKKKKVTGLYGFIEQCSELLLNRVRARGVFHLDFTIRLRIVIILTNVVLAERTPKNRKCCLSSRWYPFFLKNSSLTYVRVQDCITNKEEVTNHGKKDGTYS